MLSMPAAFVIKNSMNGCRDSTRSNPACVSALKMYVTTM
jgi:hypothetical protein